MKKTLVISLGGSLIIPDKVDEKFLLQFLKVLKEYQSEYSFVVVCGGGSIARAYITALRNANRNETLQSFAGIGATRMNARFMYYLSGINPKKGIPHTMHEVKKRIAKEKIIFCGALEYAPHQTSDATAAKIARELKCEFVNLTNVAGLFTKNPEEHKDAKQIPQITWRGFNELVQKIHFKPGQHFVLDQTAGKMIEQSKTTTYILGKDLHEFKKLLEKKSFYGTTISG